MNIFTDMLNNTHGNPQTLKQLALRMGIVFLGQLQLELHADDTDVH